MRRSPPKIRRGGGLSPRSGAKYLAKAARLPFKKRPCAMCAKYRLPCKALLVGEGVAEGDG